MPIIFIHKVPSNADRYLIFVAIAFSLCTLVPLVGGLALLFWNAWVALAFGVLTCAGFSTVAIVIDHKVGKLLDWELNQPISYCLPREAAPQAKTVFDKVAHYIVRPQGPLDKS